jgi:hypothetical protein
MAWAAQRQSIWLDVSRSAAFALSIIGQGAVAYSPVPNLRILYKTVQSVGSLERKVVRHCTFP